MRWVIFFCVVAFSVGVCGFVFCCHAIGRELRFGRTAERRSGRVIRFAEFHSPQKTYAPVVEWIGPDGASRQFVGHSGRGARRKYKIDGDIKILLGPDRNQLRVCIDHFGVRYGDALSMAIVFIYVMGVMGVFFEKWLNA